MVEPNNIYLGDCLEVMKDIPDNSIDAVICDLPYGVLNRNNKDAQWDNIIDIPTLFGEYKRICKDKAPIVLFGQGMFTAKLMTLNPELWRYNLIWDKAGVTGFLDANRKPLRCHEDIIVFSKAGYHTYNPQMERVPLRLKSHNRKGGNNNERTNTCYGHILNVPSELTDEKYPRSIITFSKSSPSERLYHPTQKPIDLIRYLIRTYSNSDDIILDNTMGSGTTCVAAIMEKRRYIGIEKDEKYFEIAKRRIEVEKAQLTLF